MNNELSDSFNSSSSSAGCVGLDNLLNEIYRRSVKKGFKLTLMVVGESGLGKSTLVNSLFLTDLYSERVWSDRNIEQTLQLDISTVEIEELGTKLCLTVIDTPGFGDAIDNQERCGVIIQYINNQFEKFFRNECALKRNHREDTRVHCCLYFISPVGHGLKPIDIEFMKQLHYKVNIIPVIGKADALIKTELERLKMQVMKEIKQHNINIYSLPDYESEVDNEYKNQLTQLKELIPFAVCGSNTVYEMRGRKVRGRLYPWGVVDIDNPEHCDFIKLKTMLVTHIHDLKEMTHDVHYETYRLEQVSKDVSESKIDELCYAYGTRDDIKYKPKDIGCKVKKINYMSYKSQKADGDVSTISPWAKSVIDNEKLRDTYKVLQEKKDILRQKLEEKEAKLQKIESLEKVQSQK